MMNALLTKNQNRLTDPVAARELVVPQQFGRMQHLLGELHEVISELDQRLQSVRRDEPPRPCPVEPKPEPDGSVMGQLRRHNDTIEIMIERVRLMTGLLEI